MSITSMLPLSQCSHWSDIACSNLSHPSSLRVDTFLLLTDVGQMIHTCSSNDLPVAGRFRLEISNLAFVGRTSDYEGSDLKTYLKMRRLWPDAVSVVRFTRV